MLLVDDDECIRLLLGQLLRESGYPVRLAAHGKAALELVRQHGPPALALVDQRMPVLDGRGLLDSHRPPAQLDQLADRGEQPVRLRRHHVPGERDGERHGQRGLGGAAAGTPARSGRTTIGTRRQCADRH